MCSGDIAYSGKESEYLEADKRFFVPLIERTGLPRNRLFLVPGNHDFDRSYLSRLNPATIKTLTSRASVNDFVADKANLESYLSPFSAYDRFARRLTQYDPPILPSWGYCSDFNVSGLDVSIIGLNSSWACGYSLVEGAAPTEKGLLVLGEKQFIDTIENYREDSIRITLIHHPLEWLAEFELATLRREILAKSNFLHHGHVHLPSELSAAYARDEHCFTFGAAACYDRRIGNDHYANGYTIVIYDSSAGTVTVRVRKYVDSPTPHWTSHEDLLGEGSGGQHSFPLPAQWLGTHEQSGGDNLAAPSSLEELYRSTSAVSQHLPHIRRALDAIPVTERTAALVLLYEQLLCSLLSFERGFTDPLRRSSLATSGVLGETLIRLGIPGL